MSNLNVKGIDVRQTGTALVFRALLQDSSGALVTSGTTSYWIDELQSDGTIKCLDFNDFTFKTAATSLTTPTSTLTHRTRNNGTNTGQWTGALSTLTGFTIGAVYIVHVTNSGASPTDQAREFVYGSAEGDLLVTAGSTGQAYLQSDLQEWRSSQPNVLQSGRVDADARAINGDTTAPANLATLLNGGNLVGDTYPALQGQVKNIASTSAALNANAASLTLTTGTETGTVANTNTLDGVFDQWADSAGTIDGYYQFNISSTTGAVGVGCTWNGYLVGAANTLKVYALNWGGSAWDQIGTIQGSISTAVQEQEFDLTSAHTGTGGNAGLVRIRFQNTGLSTATLKTDRILLGYAQVLTPPANWSASLISSSGNYGIDWANVANPTATVNLSGTTVGALTTNNDKTNYGLANNAISSSKIATNTFTSGQFASSFFNQWMSRYSAAAQAGGASTITLDSGAVSTDSYYNGQIILITSGAGIGQARVITAYVGSTKVATVDTAWATNPDNTSTFNIIAAHAPKLDGNLQTTAASVQGNVTGSVGSVIGAVGSVTGNVGGSVLGDIEGKVLGGGGSVITAAGVWALDGTGAALATSANQSMINSNVLTRMATYTQPTGFLAATFPTTGTVAKQGDKMDLVDAPNATAVTAIQSGLASVANQNAIKTQTDRLGTMLIIVGSGPNYQYTSQALANAPSGGGSGLSGPSSVTLSFVDASNNPVPNVEFTVVGQGTARAGTNGQAAFGLPNGTYTVAAGPVGLVMFANATLVVSGTTTLTISGTSIIIPAPGANQVTVYAYTRDSSGALAAGIPVIFQIRKGPGSTGSTYDSSPVTVISDGSFIASRPLPIGATFRYRCGIRGLGEWSADLVVPASGPYQLPDVIGPYSG